MPFTFVPIESNDSVSPNSGGFAPEGAKADWTFQIRGEDLKEECLAIVGSTRPMGDGRLRRDVPRLHPQLPWLMATSIASFRGVGLRDEANESIAELVDSEASDDLPAVTDQYLRYASYDVRVNFESPSFNLLRDWDVSLLGGLWYDDDNTGQPFTYATEWERFTDLPRYSKPEFVQYKHGMMKFRTNVVGLRPDNHPFPGLVRIASPKQELRLRWIRVPESYVTSASSYLERFLYRVNQNEWLDFKPGELLYTGWDYVNRSTPPFPNTFGLPFGLFGGEKLVDLELKFGICRFVCEDAPIPLNANWIASGWNLQIWHGDRKPHYVTATGVNADGAPDPADSDGNKWIPAYRSCPVELMFTDPDFVQNIGQLRVGG